jgi:hypothetical protein
MEVATRGSGLEWLVVVERKGGRGGSERGRREREIRGSQKKNGSVAPLRMDSKDGWKGQRQEQEQ